MRKKSKRSKKSNRISWASGDKLCQIKLFSSEDCPAIVGLKSQDDLQAKKPEILHSDSNDLPPGFDSRPNVSQILWKRPPKFALNHAWQVASGEESEEVKRQSSREPRVLEAVYPRFSAIPSGPSVSPEVEKEHHGDTLTPVIPITPIEEEEEEEEAKVETIPPMNTTTKPVSNPSVDKPLVHLAEAIRTSNEKGSLIDTDLLIKILSDKQMIKRLLVPDGASVSEPKPTPTPPFHPRPIMALSSAGPIVHQEARPAVQHVVRPPIPPPVVSIPEPARPPSFVAAHEPVKDMNYFKNLIRQHGEEKEEIIKEDYYHRNYEPKPANNNYNHHPVVEFRNKNTRPCVFFNTPRGCLKGASCQFQHDFTAQWQPHGQVIETSHHHNNNNSAKRMKLSGEINGGMLV